MAPVKLTNQTNRYGASTPTSFTSTGIAVSTPVYITLNTEASKALLNAFREIKRQQLHELGYSEVRTSNNLMVVSRGEQPQTQIEKDSGFNEETLRQVLFTRNGISERTIIKLQNLTGIKVVSKQETKEAMRLWHNALYDQQSTKQTSSTSS